MQAFAESAAEEPPASDDLFDLQLPIYSFREVPCLSSSTYMPFDPTFDPIILPIPLTMSQILVVEPLLASSDQTELDLSALVSTS